MDTTHVSSGMAANLNKASGRKQVVMHSFSLKNKAQLPVPAPDHPVIDLGSTAVTGIHVHAVSQLRRYFGLQRKPVRVIEPFQMLGEIDWELIDSIGIDVVGAWGKDNLFGFYNHAP